jgi:hypothetical protein
MTGLRPTKYCNDGGRNHRLARVLPHLVDTLVLLSAAGATGVDQVNLGHRGSGGPEHNQPGFAAL